MSLNYFCATISHNTQHNYKKMNDEYNNSSICRVCLHDVNNKSRSLFDNYRKSFIHKYIAKICDVHITSNDKLPNKICSECLLDLDTAVKFRYKCQRANLILHSSQKFDTAGLNAILKEENLGANTSGYDTSRWSPRYNAEVKSEKIDTDSKIKLEHTNQHFNNKSIDVKLENEYTSLNNDLKYSQTCKTGYSADESIAEVKKSKAIDLKLECNECGDHFRSKCKMAVHWKRVHLTQNLICNYCKRAFKSIKAYNRHKKDVSKACNIMQMGKCRVEGVGKARMFYCNTCEYKSKHSKDVRIHTLTHSGEKPHACNICNKEFSQLSSLNSHKEFIHKIYEMETTCQYCGKHLKGRRVIYKHLKQHESLGIKCEVCNKMLKNKYNLTIHMQRHMGEKNYVCDKCPLRFFSSPELINHLRKHQDRQKQLRFKCTRCKFVAIRKDQLTRHLNNHIDCNVPCTICGQYVDSKKSLVTHLRRHEEKKINCSVCGRKYQRMSSMRDHMRKAHNFRISEFLKSKIITNKRNSVKLSDQSDIKQIEITLTTCLNSS